MTVELFIFGTRLFMISAAFARGYIRFKAKKKLDSIVSTTKFKLNLQKVIYMITLTLRE